MLAGFLLLRRSMLDELGGFDEGYRLYGEDIDLQYRAMRAGWERWYVPAAVVRHEHKAETDKKWLTRRTLWHWAGRRALRAQASRAAEGAVKDVVAKYDEVAERYSAHDYADAERYYERRAQLSSLLGVQLAAGCDGARHRLRRRRSRPAPARARDRLPRCRREPRMVEIARARCPATVSPSAASSTSPRSPSTRRRSSARSISFPTAGVPRARPRRSRGEACLRLRPARIRRARAARRRARRRLAATSRSGRSCSRSAARCPRPVQACCTRSSRCPGARILTRVRFPLFVTASGELPVDLRAELAASPMP